MAIIVLDYALFCTVGFMYTRPTRAIVSRAKFFIITTIGVDDYKMEAYSRIVKLKLRLIYFTFHPSFHPSSVFEGE